MGARKAASVTELSESLEKEEISDYDIFLTKTDTYRGMYTLVGHAELALFCSQFSILSSSRVPLIEVVQLMAFQTKNKTLRTALNEIYDIMEAGYGFTEAFSMYSHIFPANIIYMAIIGEQSGALGEIFENLSEHYESQAELRQKFRSAVIYPAIFSVLMGIVIVFLMFYVMPVFRGILVDMGHELSYGTELIMGVGNILGIVVLALILTSAIVFALVRLYLRSSKSRNSVWFSNFKLNGIFIRHIYRRNLIAKMASALSILLRSGAGLVNAMEVVTPLVENDSVQEKFMYATQDISDGKDIGEAFEQIGIFPASFIKMVIVGDRAAKLDEMIEKAGEIADEEANVAIERIISVIEPALIIVLSLIACIMLLAVMLPIIDLMAAIG